VSTYAWHCRAWLTLMEFKYSWVSACITLFNFFLVFKYLLYIIINLLIMNLNIWLSLFNFIQFAITSLNLFNKFIFHFFIFFQFIWLFWLIIIIFNNGFLITSYIRVCNYIWFSNLVRFPSIILLIIRRWSLWNNLLIFSASTQHW
jgi:hypothetical protein